MSDISTIFQTLTTTVFYSPLFYDENDQMPLPIIPLPLHPQLFLHEKNPVSSILCYFSHFVLQKKRNNTEMTMFHT